MATDIGTETKVALRRLRRSPGFALAAVAVLALGIGANVAIFSAVKATLITPPPYPEPEHLVLLDLTRATADEPEPPQPIPWSYPKYRILAETRDRLADPVAAYAVRTLTLTGAGDARRVSTEIVTPDYLEVLDVAPLAGRDLEAADDTPGAEPMALLGHALWRERFGAEPGVVGRTVTLNGRPVVVAGVAPPGFRGLSGSADLWLPVHAGANLTAPFLVSGGQAHWLQVIGRLRPEADLEALRSQMASIGTAAEAAYPDSDPTAIRSGGARSLLEARVHPEARRSLLILSAAAMLLLLVACANLAGLFVARSGARSRETAVRIALGSSRRRAARGALAESLLLAGAGGALGVLVARAGADLLASSWPARFLDGSWNLRFTDPAAIRLDGTALTFAAVLALATGLASAIVPAMAAARRDPGLELRGGASGTLGDGRRRPGLRSGLVAAEVAVTLVLVVGAGLLFRSLAELQAVDRGVDPEGLLALQYDLPRTSGWADDPVAFHQAYLERLRALPGVRSASLGCAVPLGGHCMITAVRHAGSTLGGLLAVFAILALLLAATGIWAVVAHGVVRRTRELGLRMALGARPTNVLALVVAQGVGPAVAGVLLGTALAWAVGRALQGLLYGVSPADPATLAGAAVVLLAISGAAAWLPARRATRIDPMEALRTE